MRLMSKNQARGTDWDDHVPVRKHLSLIYPRGKFPLQRRVKIGIADTGVDYNHPEIAHAIADESNFKERDDIQFDFNPNEPELQHGTSVASIAVGGSTSIEIVPILYDENLWHEIAAAYEHGTRLFNFSFHYDPQDSSHLIHYLEVFEDQFRLYHDVLFIVASGNDGKNIDENPIWPASLSSEYPNVISVAALGSQDHPDSARKLSNTSNYGTRSVQLAAPGKAVKAARRGGEYDLVSGTSFAAPAVANLAARILEINDRLHVNQVVEILKNSAMQSEDLSNKVSWGAIHEERALKMARETIPSASNLE
jgi:subtilisin family serine protease